MKTLSAKQHAEKLIKELGKEGALLEVNKSMEFLCSGLHASSNYYQIKYYLNIIKHVKT
jgi:hypothetical protein